ncbi:hypothetical protein A2U01_0014013, partial [Trifolium medium]|nr:hypothetical protein [Trifolium medium]
SLPSYSRGYARVEASLRPQGSARGQPHLVYEDAVILPAKYGDTLRGGNHVIDNDEVLDRRVVSLMGLEETGALSGSATCLAYESA